MIAIAQRGSVFLQSALLRLVMSCHSIWVVARGTYRCRLKRVSIAGRGWSCEVQMEHGSQCLPCGEYQIRFDYLHNAAQSVACSWT